MKLKFNNAILRLLVSSIIIFLSVGDIENSSTTYRVLVDGYYGFYRLSNEGTGEPIPYLNHTFNVSIGDKIVWINEDLTDTITIISEQKLWGDNIGVLYSGRQFNYTFNDPGIYTFYIRQYSMLPKQTIMVLGNNTDDIISNNDTNLTINITAEPTISPTIDPIVSQTIISVNSTDTVDINETIGIPDNTVDISTENITLINPILMPLDILKNIKITGMVTFVIIIMLSFLRKNGERK